MMIEVLTIYLTVGMFLAVYMTTARFFANNNFSNRFTFKKVVLMTLFWALAVFLIAFGKLGFLTQIKVTNFALGLIVGLIAYLVLP